MRNEKIIEVTCNLGKTILEIFGPGHEFHEIAKLILESTPDEEYPFYVSEEYLCHELSLYQEELDELFMKYESQLMSAFMSKEPFTISEIKTIDIPFKGSSFIFELDDESMFAFNLNKEILIDLGKWIAPNFFNHRFGEDYFRVKFKSVQMDFDGYYHVYILERIMEKNTMTSTVLS